VYILTGTIAQSFDTSALGAGDTKFYIVLKNGNAAAGADIALTSVGNVSTLRGPTSTTNSGLLYAVWNGSSLSAY